MPLGFAVQARPHPHPLPEEREPLATPFEYLELGLVERRNTLFPLLGERVRVRANSFSASFEKSYRYWTFESAVSPTFQSASAPNRRVFCLPY
jgi:hypothetical protein